MISDARKENNNAAVIAKKNNRDRFGLVGHSETDYGRYAVCFMPESPWKIDGAEIRLYTG